MAKKPTTETRKNGGIEKMVEMGLANAQPTLPSITIYSSPSRRSARTHPTTPPMPATQKYRGEVNEYLILHQSLHHCQKVCDYLLMNRQLWLLLLDKLTSKIERPVQNKL
jgi:hypothetical protein